MKKTRFIALVLAVAVMLIGAGYAWWNETVAIESRVTMGNLEVEIGTNVTYKTGYMMYDNDYSMFVPYFVENEDYVDIGTAGKTTIEGNEAIRLTYTNVYPGAYVAAFVPITNTGTVPVQLNKVFGESLTNNNSIDITVVSGADSSNIQNYYTNPLDYPFFNPSIEDNTVVYYGPDLEIIPGETKYIYVGIQIDGPGNGNDTERKTVTYTLKPEFIQFNQYNPAINP